MLPLPVGLPELYVLVPTTRIARARPCGHQHLKLASLLFLHVGPFFRALARTCTLTVSRPLRSERSAASITPRAHGAKCGSRTRYAALSKRCRTVWLTSHGGAAASRTRPRSLSATSGQPDHPAPSQSRAQAGCRTRHAVDISLSCPTGALRILSSCTPSDSNRD